MVIRLRFCLGLLVMVGVGLAGCADETGVLIEVTRGEATPSPDRLVVLVGSGDVSASRYADREPGDDVDVSERDLASDPFRLLIRPSDMESMVMVAALGYREGELVAFGRLASPVGFAPGSVRSWQIVLGPADGVDVGDGGCVRWREDDGTREVAISQPGDLDCDGWTTADDCDDSDPAVHPGASERCGNAVDDDCNGTVDEDVDEDGDGFTTCGTGDLPADCDDSLAEVNPNAEEICDGLDNDCSGGCDEAFDADLDRFTTCGSRIDDDGSCEPPDDAFIDCNDASAFAHPGKGEICDGLDNDCNGFCDDGELDLDGDGYNACGSYSAKLSSCAMNDAWIDCAPEDAAIHPAAPELCNGVDDNCDGALATEVPCVADDGEAGCAIIHGACDEGAPDDVVCVGITTEQQPQEVCELVETCAAEGVDLLECIADFSDSDVCQLSLIGTQLCPGNAVNLPAGTGECQWALLGPAAQGGLRLTLSSDVDPEGGTSVVGCNAKLTVGIATDNEGAIETSRDVYVSRVDDAGAFIYHLHIVVAQVATCSPPAGLECSGAITGIPLPDPLDP